MTAIWTTTEAADMGALKVLVSLLAVLWFGWDLRLVGWNPIRYAQEIPPADRTTAALLAGVAALTWLVDYWTGDRDRAGPRRPLRSWLFLIAGWTAIIVLLIQNVIELDGNLLALAELPHHVSFWLLLASVLGTLWAYDQHAVSFAVADTHGSAGWATAADIKPLLGPANHREPGSIVVAYGRRGHPIILPRELARHHVLTIGVTGSGKTRSFYMPNAADPSCSFAATDPKGELWRYTSGYQQEAWRLAPMREDSTHGLNWIPCCMDVRVAQKLAAAAMQTDEDTHEQQFWKLSDQQLRTALFTHVAHLAAPTPATLYEFLKLGPSALVVQLADSPSEQARIVARTMAELRPELRAGIVMSTAQKLRFLQDPRVRRFTSCDTEGPDFRVLVDRRVAVYWQVHEQDAELLTPLSSLFFTLLLHQLCTGPDDEELPAPVMLLLDEFGQVGTIPGFANTVVVARGRGVALALGVQSLAQLEHLYGRAGAEIIRGNCVTKMVLPGLDYDTAEHVSRALGETTIRQEYQSRRPEGFFATSYSYGEHHTERRLLTADEVRRIGDDEALLIVANYKPIRARRKFWDKPPNPAPAGQLAQAQTTVIREPVKPPANNITPLRRRLQQLQEDDAS